jgi:hypothetical protein
MKTYEEMRNELIEELKNDDNLFVAMIEELDSWNGFADGFRAYEMYMINELFYDCKVSDFLDKLAPGFNHNDDYMIDTIYGIDSTNDLIQHYRDNVWESELLDNLMEEIDDLDFWNHEDFKEKVEKLNELNTAA